MFYKFSDAPVAGHVMPDFYYKRNLDKGGRTAYWRPRGEYDLARPKMPETSNGKIAEYNSWNEIRTRKQFPSDPASMYSKADQYGAEDKLPWNRTNLIQRKEPKPIGYTKIIPKSYEELYGIKRPEQWYEGPPPLHSTTHIAPTGVYGMNRDNRFDIKDNTFDNHMNPGKKSEGMMYSQGSDVKYPVKYPDKFRTDYIDNMGPCVLDLPIRHNEYNTGPKIYKYGTKINNEPLRSDFVINVRAPEVLDGTVNKPESRKNPPLRPGQNVVASGAYNAPWDYLYYNKAKPGTSYGNSYQKKIKTIVPESDTKTLILKRGHVRSSPFSLK